MRLKKELMLLSVISIVFLAGCAGGGGEAPASNGFVITSFSPDITNIDGGSTVSFVVNVKNLGEKTAKKLDATIFGLSNEWTDIETNAKFSINKNYMGTLAGADVTTGLTGEEGSTSWDLTAPAGKTTDITYDVSVRVNGTYNTTADGILRIVQSSYLKTNPNVQRGVISSSSSGGPIVITVKARTPVVSPSVDTARVQFEIQNAGSGRVYSTIGDPTDTIDTLTRVTVSSSSDLQECAGTTDATNTGKGTNDDNEIGITTNLRLAGGKSKVISCDIKVSTANFQDMTVNMTLDYYYFVDSAAQVTVLRALQ